MKLKYFSIMLMVLGVLAAGCVNDGTFAEDVNNELDSAVSYADVTDTAYNPDTSTLTVTLEKEYSSSVKTHFLWSAAKTMQVAESYPDEIQYVIIDCYSPVKSDDMRRVALFRTATGQNVEWKSVGYETDPIAESKAVFDEVNWYID